MNELNKLFIDELSDIYSAESQLVKALPKMAKAARSQTLKDAFNEHLTQTEQQVERVKQVFSLFDKPVRAKKCRAMEGLLEEAKEIMDEHKGSPALDAALISAAQKVEHYEIASYGCLRTWAKLLDKEEAVDLLQETLDEESATDEKLNQIAEVINVEADVEA